MTQRFWFFSAISLTDYLKKYPWVFALSLLSGLSGLVELVFHLALWQPQDVGIPGFATLTRCFQLGVPLFAILDICLNSPSMKKFKYRMVVHALGIIVLFGFFAFFNADTALDNSLQFIQLYALLLLALFMIPLLPKLNDPKKQWIYLGDLTLTAASAFLIYSVATVFFLVISDRLASNNFIASYLFMPGMEGFSFGLTGFLVLTWYAMGFLDKALDPRKKQDEAGVNLGTALTYGLITLVLIFYLWDICAILKYFLSPSPEISFSFDSTFYLVSTALGWGSLVFLTPLKLRKRESWMDDYRKLVAIATLIVLAFTVYLFIHAKPWGDMSLNFQMSFILQMGFVLWMAGTMLYYLFVKEASWAKPLLGLLALLVITLAGPLSPQEIAFKVHRAHLEKLLISSNVLVNGHVQKPKDSLDQEPYSKIEEEFTYIASYCGINRLQPWFNQDLKPLLETNEPQRHSDYGYVVAERLMQSIGFELCNTVGSDGTLRNYSADYKNEVIDISGGYTQEQRIHFGPGCPVIRAGYNDKKYVTGLSNSSRTLTVQFGSELLADMPLDKISQVLKAHDYHETFRSRIPQKDLTLTFENNKVRLKVCFQSLEGFKDKDTIRVTSGNGTLLVQRK